MTFSIHDQPRAARLATLAAVAALLAGAATGAAAQYKIVGPDGRVTYTDKPPAPADARAATPGTGGTTSSGAALPVEVRQAMTRYPVTLYAAKGCAPCDQARQWLKGRGIPFSEYSISSNADIAALEAKFGGREVPVITFGGQVIRAWSPGEVGSYADAAGYPKQARLVGYNWPAATPLAPQSAAPAAAAEPAPAPAPALAAPPAPKQSSSGIQF
jgi:glutaredoxin